MARRGGTVCAGVCALLLAGCVGEDFWQHLRADSRGSHEERCIVPGGLSSVSLTVQQKLSDRGLLVRARRDGEAVRIESSTGGKRFVLRLSALEGDKLAETLVRVQWEGEADGAFWQALADELTGAADAGAGAQR
jgi:hypothetical protein